MAPYILPRIIDSAGNNHGYVFAFPQPDAYRAADCRTGGLIACELEQLGLPVYHFTDDNKPRRPANTSRRVAPIDSGRRRGDRRDVDLGTGRKTTR